MDNKLDLIAIGESLVELSTDESLENAECLHKYYGGDVLAAAVAARRLGSKVGFITKLGNDAFKDFLISGWREEGLDISQVTFADERNGLYLIARPSYTEKQVAYYRKKTAPSRLSVDDISEDYISSSKFIYSSGVTQSLSISAREAVKKSFEIAHQFGGITAYDPNYTNNIWSVEDAKECFSEIIGITDILFLSARHDMPMLGLESIDSAMKYYTDMGVSTIVIKSAQDKGYFVCSGGSEMFVDFYTSEVSDTTCSGDAFNGGFLHALASGMNSFDAAKMASVTAGLQAKGVGAIKSIPYREQVYSIYGGKYNG